MLEQQEQMEGGHVEPEPDVHELAAPQPVIPGSRREFWIRATVHLAGLPVGAIAKADPNDPYIAEELLPAGFVVETPPPDDLPKRRR